MDKVTKFPRFHSARHWTQGRGVLPGRVKRCYFPENFASEIRCPFGKNRELGLVYHLSSNKPVVKGVSSNPSKKSTNQWEKDIYDSIILSMEMLNLDLVNLVLADIEITNKQQLVCAFGSILI